MSVPQIALHIGKWWTEGPPKPHKSPQSLTCQCDVSSSKKPFTRSFFHLTSHFSIIILKTDPIFGQEILLAHYIFKQQPSDFIYTWFGPLAGVSTNFYKITSLSFLSLSLQCLTKDFVQGARRNGGHAEITHSQSDSFWPFVYTCPRKCIKHLSYS